MDVRRTAVVAASLVAIGLVAVTLAGTAAAWSDNETHGDAGLTDDGTHETGIEETVGAVSDTIEETFDRSTGPTGPTAPTSATGRDGDLSNERGDPLASADGGTTDDVATARTTVEAEEWFVDAAVERREAAGAVRLSVLADVTWTRTGATRLAFELGSVDRPAPVIDPAPPDARDLPTLAVTDPPVAVTHPPVAEVGGGSNGPRNERAVDAPGVTRPDGETGVSERAGAPGAIGNAAEAGTSSFLDSLAPFTGVPIPGTAIPAWAVLFVLFVKPLASGLSGLLAVLTDRVGRLLSALRFGRDAADPLEHDVRARLVDRIEDSPGVTLTELAEGSEASLSTIRYHVRVLEAERHVTSEKIRGNRRFFPRGTTDEALLAALEDEPAGSIIAILQERDGATVGDLVEAADRSYSTVSYHLQRLSEDGIVVRTKEGRETVTRLAPGVRATLANEDSREPAEAATEVGAD